jgi:Fe-S oxidoreductase
MKVTPPEHPSTELHYGDPAYLDAEKLERELRRSAEVCHQCRRCLPLCPAFPQLFELVDASPDEVAGVAMSGFDEVNELCFHCKLCYNHCPYTPPHEWDIDFPALMRRHQIARARRDGIPLARKLTTQTDLLGRLGSRAPRLMNFANRSRVSRILMEKTLGIHRDWVQPSFHGETLAQWFAKRGSEATGSNGHVVFFTPSRLSSTATCGSRSATSAAVACRSRTPATWTRRCATPRITWRICCPTSNAGPPSWRPGPRVP